MHILIHNMFFNIIFHSLILNPNLKSNQNLCQITNPYHKFVYEPNRPLTFITHSGPNPTRQTRNPKNPKLK